MPSLSYVQVTQQGNHAWLKQSRQPCMKDEQFMNGVFLEMWMEDFEYETIMKSTKKLVNDKAADKLNLCSKMLK